MKLKINVTQEDITKSIEGSIFSCPLALALNRDYGPGWRVLASTIVYQGEHKRWNYEMSKEMYKFRLTFNTHGRKAVSPRVFLFEGEGKLVYSARAQHDRN